jgi:hypothetical protein
MKGMSSSRFPGSGTAGSTGSILVFGWLTEAPPSVSVEGSGLTQQTNAIVYTALDYGVPDSGYLSVPTGLIPGAMTKNPTNGGSCGVPGTVSVNMGRGEAELEYLIPKNLLARGIDTLKMNLYSDNAAMWGSPSLALYRWEDGAWVTIQDPIQGINVIGEAKPYVNAGGVVRVRVSSENDNYRCIYVDLGLETGKPAGGAQ